MNKMWDWARSMWHKPSIYMQYRRFSIFKGLNSFQLYLIHGLMHKREFKAGEVLFEVGYPMEVVYFVEKGEICLNDGGQIIGKNQVLGLWDLFVGAKRHSTARAISDVSAFAISRSDLLELIEAKPAMGITILKAICTDIASEAIRIRSLGV
ncbi:MAG: Crp/Fnr family transcriptional regulator [Candidatus Cloacimonetes bacterium]|nr:Crp/Fnr family transcriptional regulator [Candidatus Cloacimonadota bacterium]HOA28659.1 Crp/Fnr family transcriptional regulator [Candidatus Cloacimonadota bacterium]